LWGGDILALAIITLAGFATHSELGDAGLRMLTTFIPLLVGWALLAPALGLFDPGVFGRSTQLYRPLLAGAFVGPMAAGLRGLWLNQPIIPIFAVVLAVTAAVGITAWRAAWWWIYSRQVRHG
jgi:hypothetical protein